MDASRVQVDAASACGPAPGTICDGLCRSFPCGDPVCTPRCGTSCYECGPGLAWTPVVTDCFCSHDAGARDLGSADADHALDASPCGAPPGDVCTTSGFCGPGTSLPCGATCYACVGTSWSPVTCECSDAGADPTDAGPAEGGA